MKSKLLLAAAALSLVACNPSDKQIESWVEKNPEKIMNALMEFQKAQFEANQPKPEMVQQYASELFKNSSSPAVGKGQIEIAYFFDFNCGHCARQSDTIKAVLAQTDNVKIVYKNLPVLGPSSELAARAALAANLQGKYTEYYSEVFKVREKSPNALKGIASKVGLNVKKWEADMNGDEVNNELRHVRELAEKMKISGTPFLAIAPDMVFPGRVDDLMGIVQSMN
jgi:protein-disulfide isomerase